MTTVLTYIIVLIVLASFFWSGYFFRIWQETKIQRRMWSNIVKRIHVTRHNLDMDVSSSDSTEFTDLEIKNLKNELKVALLNEDYEEASKIRDLIRRLES
tara:strand:- start:1003 stop:1302 length:300 start_codon:yes stop_codon:yes gene_type:complete